MESLLGFLYRERHPEGMDGTVWDPYLVALKVPRAPMEVEDQREHVVDPEQNLEEELDTHEVADLLVLQDAF